MNLPSGTPSEGIFSSDPKTIEQRAAITRMQREGGSTTDDHSNVPARYANSVLAPNGELFPLSALTLPEPGPISSRNYWQGIIDARRYLIIANAAGQPVGTVGAIADSNAQAIMNTYDDTGRSADVEATRAAERAAVTANIGAAAVNPVTYAPAVPAAQVGANVEVTPAPNFSSGAVLPEGFTRAPAPGLPILRDTLPQTMDTAAEPSALRVVNVIEAERADSGKKVLYVTAGVVIALALAAAASRGD